MKTFKRILKTIFILAIMGIVYSFFFSVYENIKINNIIKDFKNRASDTPVNEITLRGVNNTNYLRRYFEVPRETSNELNDTNNVFYDDKKMKLGIDGDIFVNRKSPFKDIPVIHQFVSFYYGGHSSIVTYENDKAHFIEALGFPDYDETLLDYIFSDGKPEHGLSSHIIKSNFNSWQTPHSVHEYHGMFYRDKYIGLRPTNPFTEFDNSDELYNEYKQTAISRGEERAENKAIYNFLFFLNMQNKYYCSDLMSRVYEEAYESVMNDKDDYRSKGYAKRLNDDGFITSIQDLILSKETFITFYVEINEEEIDGETVIVENIYYLEDVE